MNNQLTKEQRQRVSGLLLLIPMSIQRVKNANPNGMNYRNWELKLKEYTQEYKSITGEDFDVTKLKDYQLRLLRRDREQRRGGK